MIHSVITVAVVICLFYGCDSRQPNDWDKLPIIKEVPDFSAINYDGSVVTKAILKGKPWVASFMFTRCQGVCPVMNRHISRLHEQFGHAVQFISFSVDPENDSIPALAEYARLYNAIPGAWLLVRISHDSVRRLSKEGFLLTDPVTPDLHSPRFALVDDKGRIRGYYNSLDSSDVERLSSLLAAYVQHRNKGQ